MAVSPYAEAYANAMRVPGTPTYQFHRATYGDMPYEGFREMFEQRTPRLGPRRVGRAVPAIRRSLCGDGDQTPRRLPHVADCNTASAPALIGTANETWLTSLTDSMAKKIMRLPPMRETFDVIAENLDQPKATLHRVGANRLRSHMPTSPPPSTPSTRPPRSGQYSARAEAPVGGIRPLICEPTATPSFRRDRTRYLRPVPLAVKRYG